MNYLIKIDRIAAWVLFVGMTLYFISGYGMTKGIFDDSLAVKLHLDYLSIIIIIAFVLHAGFATRLAFIRWRMWNLPTKVIWGMFFVSFFYGFIYLDQFYEKKVSNKPNVTTTTKSIDGSVSTSTSTTKNNAGLQSVTTTTIPIITATTLSSEKIFNATELAKYNGKNGNPPYVAVDGMVYDMTEVFVSGRHFSHLAGEELTSAFYGEHVKQQITKYPVVGKYIN